MTALRPVTLDACSPLVWNNLGLFVTHVRVPCEVHDMADGLRRGKNEILRGIGICLERDDFADSDIRISVTCIVDVP